MARSFVAASTQYLGYLGLIQDLPFTVAGWARPTSSTDGGALFSLGNSANNNTRVQVMWYGSTSTKVYRARHVPDGGGAQDAHGTTGVALGDWSHWCATFPSASSRTIYTNGGNPVTNSTPVAGITTLDRSAVGTYLRATAVNPFDGDIAEVGVWYGTLNAGQIAELAAGKSPLLVSPQTLVAYWPLHGELSTSDENNFLAGYTLTQVASPAKADHPRIILPKRRQIFLGAVGGGGTSLTVSDAAQAHTLDNVVLTSSTALVVQDMAHGHALDAATLSTGTALSVADSLHAHALDNVTLSTAGAISLIVADLAHAQALDAVVLTSQTDLVVADLTHGHALDGVILTLGGVNLVIADIMHAHALDNVALTLDTYLAVADLLHAHTIDNVLISIPGGTLDLILKILVNRQELNPATGTFTLYDDDGVTVLYTTSAWADAAGTVPYSGGALRRIDALI